MRKNIEHLVPFGKTSGFLIDDDSLCLISGKEDAHTTSQLIVSRVGFRANILDLTAGVGGNVISFGHMFKKVTALEINKKRAELCVKNCSSYKLKNVSVINGDAIDYILTHNIREDVVFFDPPWGGKGYGRKNNLRLFMGDMTVEDLCLILCKKNRNILIVVKLPLNYDWQYFHETLSGTFDINKTRINKIAIVMMWYNKINHTYFSSEIDN